LAQVIHPVDLLIDLVGPPDDYESMVHRHENALTVAVQLGVRGNWVASIVAGTSAQRFSFALNIVTDKGVIISCNDLWDVLIEGMPVDSEIATLPWTRRWSAGALDRGYSRAGYQGELVKFFDAVRHRTPFAPNLSDLLPTYHVLDQIEKNVRKAVLQ
jgi:hypothetical protein